MSTEKPQEAKFTSFEVARKRDQTIGRVQADTEWIIPEGAGSQDPWKGTEGLLKPLMPPEHLVEIYRKSSEVPKNARARAQNVAGFGWDLDPVINFKDPKLTEKAAQYIFLDRVAQYRRDYRAAILAKASPEEISAIKKPLPPTEAEIEATVKGWQRRAEMERSLLSIKLKNFCYEYPLQELFKRTEVNRGGLGYCGWEIIRDEAMTPIRAKLIEPMWLRPTEEDPTPIPVPWLRETSKVTYEVAYVERRFRRWLMRHNEVEIWFKEFGDPRTVSNISGKVYDSPEELDAAIQKNKEKQDAKPATELIVWSEYSPGAEPCGMPIWHGHSLDVETSRASKEYDYDELVHGKIPRGILSAIDASIDSPIIEALEKFFKEGGIGNRTRVALVQMATASMAKVAGAGRAIFDFTDFSKAQRDDATHLKLKESADDGVSQDFGNPAVLLGNSKAIQNRSVAEVSQQVAEEQTYSSLRSLWAHWINQFFVRPWNFRFWTFKFKAPRLQQAEAVGKLIEILIKQHVITPDQARSLAATLLGIELLGEPEDYQRVPPDMAKAGMTQQLLHPIDNPLTVEDESEGEVDEGADEEIDSEVSAKLLEELGIIATSFTDGPSVKMRQRLGLLRKSEAPPSDIMDGFWGVDD